MSVCICIDLLLQFEIHMDFFSWLERVLRPKENICVYQVSCLKKLGMVGWHNFLFCRNILYRNCIF